MPVEITDRGTTTLIVYDRYLETTGALIRKAPLPLLSVGNRYLCEHQMEWLSDAGYRKLRFSLFDRQRETEQLVGDGERWGAKVAYSIDPASLNMKEILRKHRHYTQNGLLILEGSAIFRFRFPAKIHHSTLFVSQNLPLPLIYLTQVDLRTLLTMLETPKTVGDLVTAAIETIPDLKWRDIPDAFYLPLTDIGEFGKMNRAIQAQPEILHFKGSPYGSQILVGRKVNLSKTCVLRGPALVGDKAILRGEAEVGPGAFIGERSFIDSGARIKNSVIAPDTYIGKYTCFENKYVSGNYVLDLEGKNYIFIDDPMIIDDFSRSWKRIVGRNRWVEKAMICLLLVFGIPLFPLLALIHRIGKGSWCEVQEILLQPVKKDLSGRHDHQWVAFHYFDFGWFPLDLVAGLFDVLKGRFSLVGNPPVTRENLKWINEDWLQDRLRGKAGFTGIFQQLDPETVAVDDIYISTIFYNANRSMFGDLRLFLRAFLPKKHRNPFKKSYAETDTSPE